MKLLALALALGLVSMPLLAVWYPKQRWMNFCWLSTLLCLIGLITLAVIAGNDDFTRTVSDKQSVVQKVEVLEAKAFTAEFQHLLLDGQMYGVTGEVSFEQGERVAIRLMRHWLFSDTRLLVCVERGCASAQPLGED
jgi:hypothetical protein